MSEQSAALGVYVGVGMEGTGTVVLSTRVTRSEAALVAALAAAEGRPASTVVREALLPVVRARLEARLADKTGDARSSGE